MSLFKKESHKITMHVSHRQHLQHPIPLQMEINPIGQVLTESEWEKFTKKLSPKGLQYCQRKINGDMIFQGEGGLEPLKHFHKKYNNRFRFEMICDNLEHANAGRNLAEKMGIPIAETYYKDPNNHKTIKLESKPEARLKNANLRSSNKR